MLEELAPAVLEDAARTELARASPARTRPTCSRTRSRRSRSRWARRAASWSQRAPTLTSGELASGVVGVPVEVLVDGLRYRTVWTSWRIEVWETRPVLAHPVRAGEELRPELFERQRVHADGAAGLEPLDPIQVVGAVAKRDLVPGEPITAHDVHRPAAVTLGATLFLRVRKGSIEARVSAVALETGTVGERIRVKTTEAGQELVATVIGRDLCEISL
jgi:flagella basal body P-ring formation protein FlgA